MASSARERTCAYLCDHERNARQVALLNVRKVNERADRCQPAHRRGHCVSGGGSGERVVRSAAAFERGEGDSKRGTTAAVAVAATAPTIEHEERHKPIDELPGFRDQRLLLRLFLPRVPPSLALDCREGHGNLILPGSGGGGGRRLSTSKNGRGRRAALELDRQLLWRGRNSSAELVQALVASERCCAATQRLSGCAATVRRARRGAAGVDGRSKVWAQT